MSRPSVRKILGIDFVLPVAPRRKSRAGSAVAQWLAARFLAIEIGSQLGMVLEGSLPPDRTGYPPSAPGALGPSSA